MWMEKKHALIERTKMRRKGNRNKRTWENVPPGPSTSRSPLPVISGSTGRGGVRRCWSRSWRSGRVVGGSLAGSFRSGLISDRSDNGRISNKLVRKKVYVWLKENNGKKYVPR